MIGVVLLVLALILYFSTYPLLAWFTCGPNPDDDGADALDATPVGVLNRKAA